MKLIDIYENIDNPLDEETLNYLYDNYGKYSTKELVLGIYYKANNEYDINQKNSYHKKLFFIWKNSILNLSEDRIKELEKRYNYKDIRRVKKVLESSLENNYNIEGVEEIYKFLTYEKIDMAYFYLAENLFNKQFNHTLSDRIDLSKDVDYEVSHRIYINIDNKNIYKFAEKLVDKFNEKNLPFYFKLTDNNRKDNFVIYSDTKNFINYMESLNEIFDENKDLQNSIYPSFIFTGKISPYYFIGDEPIQESNLNSFNSLRVECVDNAMNKTIKKWMYYNQNILLKRNEEVMNFKDYVTDKVINMVLMDMVNEKKYLAYHNFNQNSLLNPNFYHILRHNLRLSVDDYINDKELDLVDIYENEKFLGAISPKIIDELINKELGNKIIHKFDNCKPAFKYYLEEEFEKNNIDINKVCFNKGTKEKFLRFSKLENKKR